MSQEPEPDQHPGFQASKFVQKTKAFFNNPLSELRFLGTESALGPMSRRPMPLQQHIKISAPFNPIHSMHMSSEVCLLPAAKGSKGSESLAPAFEQYVAGARAAVSQARLPNVCEALSSHPIRVLRVVNPDPQNDSESMNAEAGSSPSSESIPASPVSPKRDFEAEDEQCRALFVDVLADGSLERKEYLQTLTFQLQRQVHDLEGKVASLRRELDQKANEQNHLDNNVFILKREIDRLKGEAQRPRPRGRQRGPSDVESDRITAPVANEPTDLELQVHLLQQHSLVKAVQAGYHRREADKYRRLYEKLVKERQEMHHECQKHANNLQQEIRAMQAMLLQHTLHEPAEHTELHTSTTFKDAPDNSTGGMRRRPSSSHPDRVRIPAQQTEPSRNSTIMPSHLTSWEWSSVPDLKLWDPRGK